MEPMEDPKNQNSPKKSVDAWPADWKWPTGWKSVHLPGDTYEDFRLEMEIAEMMSSLEERDPEAYAAELKRANEQRQAHKSKASGT